MSIAWALLIIRVVAGVTLIGHGTQKSLGWFGGPGYIKLEQGFKAKGYRPVQLWTGLVILGEVGGGLSLVFGFLTPLGAAGALGAMVMAIRTHWGKGFFQELTTAEDSNQLPKIDPARHRGFVERLNVLCGLQQALGKTRQLLRRVPGRLLCGFRYAEFLAFAVKDCQGHQRQGVTSRLVETCQHLLFAGVVVQVLPEENSFGLAKLVGKTLNTDLGASFAVHPN